MCTATASSSQALQELTFNSIFRVAYPEKDKLAASGRRKTTGTRKYECLICEDPGWSNQKRDNAVYHAKKRHAALLSGRESISFDGASSEISSTRPIESFYPSRPSETTLRRVFDRQRYIEAIVGLLTRRRLPFSAVTWGEMHEVVLAGNPAIEDMLLKSRHAAMKHIAINFDLYGSQLKSKLYAAQSMIHISSDLWTSPHRHSILAVCARWVDSNYQPQKALLGMPECRHTHSGECQAALIIQTLQKYGISRQIGYHTGDNATSNNTCLQHLSKALRNEYNVNFDPQRRRIRCIGHIINLSLQAFLLASSKEALNAALNAASDTSGTDMYEQFTMHLVMPDSDQPAVQSNTTDRQRNTGGKAGKRQSQPKSAQPPSGGGNNDNFRGWQANPALRKLHNLAIWLRNSSLHSNRWDDAVGLRLGIDNDTRWSSWYKLIDNLIRKQGKVKQFLLDHDEDLDDNVFTGKDWETLNKTHQFLQPFTSATLWAEGSYTTLSQTLTIMDGLLRHYEKRKEYYSQENTLDRHMLHSIEMGWYVLDKYYTMTEDVPVYAAALLLDPSKRAKYIRQKWPEEWHESAFSAAYQLWEEEYETIHESTTSGRSTDVTPSQSSQKNEWELLLDEMDVAEDLTDGVDDFNCFINAPPIRISGSPLIWWCRRDQRRTYPRLSRMAIDILSIPPESADAESAFSGGRRTLSWDRERMTCENLERVESVGNWLRERHIKLAIHGGMGITFDQGITDNAGGISDEDFD